MLYLTIKYWKKNRRDVQTIILYVRTAYEILKLSAAVGQIGLLNTSQVLEAKRLPRKQYFFLMRGIFYAKRLSAESYLFFYLQLTSRPFTPC